jgi:hypothetical protein
VTTPPSVAGAAMLAGLIVAGGAYTARHDLGLGAGLPASATARARLEQELLHPARLRHRHELLSWHPPKVPKIHPRRVAPAPQPVIVTASAAPVAAAPAATAAPVTRTSPAPPVTRTSPVGGDDGGSGGGDD